VTLQENLKVLKIIPKLAGIILLGSSLLTVTIGVIDAWSTGTWMLSRFLMVFKIGAIVMSLVAAPVAIQTAAENPQSWLGKMAAAIYGLSVFALVCLAVPLLISAFDRLYHEHFTLLLVVAALIAYIACYYLNSRNRRKE
jgi:hypothetical protein